MAARFAVLIAGLWAGVLLCIAAIAAPSAFSTLAVPEAGRYVMRVFTQEAYLSLGTAIVLFTIERQRARQDAGAGAGSVFSANLMILLGTLFCTVAGGFALPPMMAAARAGHTGVSMMTLHGVAAALFMLKSLLVLALAWRLNSAARTS